MRKLFCVLAIMALVAIPAFAQDHPKAEVFGGYQYTRINPTGLPGFTGDNFNGWNAALTGWVNPWLGITADFSGAYKSSSTIFGTPAGVNISVRQYTFMFGPTIASHANEKFVPFAHFLIGGAHCSVSEIAGPNCFGTDSNALAFAFGGGVDVGSKNVAFRIGQFDYIRGRLGNNVGINQNEFRYSAGIVFRIH